MRPLLLLLCCAATGISQILEAGVKGGVPLTDFVSTAKTVQANNYNIFSSHINRYIVGVSSELRLPFGLGVEVDVLYRHLNYQNSSGSSGVTTVSSIGKTTANAWEFPLLLKYRFPTKGIRPFLDAGVAFDTLQGLKQSVEKVVGTAPSTTTTSTPAELQHKTTRGFVIGGGLDIHLLIHIVPEVRYTRWGAEHFFDPNGLLHTNVNQGEFLLGITFYGHKLKHVPTASRS